jgi:hypothetical protein
MGKPLANRGAFTLYGRCSFAREVNCPTLSNGGGGWATLERRATRQHYTSAAEDGASVEVDDFSGYVLRPVGGEEGDAERYVVGCG